MTGERMQLVASCATPPVPPSLLEAAAHPLTGAEHIAAGSMEYETDIFESDDDESDDESDGSSSRAWMSMVSASRASSGSCISSSRLNFFDSFGRFRAIRGHTSRKLVREQKF